MATGDVSQDVTNISIVLCGQTGVGKSTLGNTLVGRKQVFKSLRTLKPVTLVQQSEEFQWETNGKRIAISVRDTPGFTGEKTSDYVNSIESSLRGCDVLLFCIPSDLSILSDIVNIVGMIRGRLQGATLPHMIIVLTKADHFLMGEDMEDAQMADLYKTESLNCVLKLEKNIKPVLQTTEVPLVVSAKQGKKIPGDICETPWLARMFYEILKVSDDEERSLFKSLAKTHPHLKDERLGESGEQNYISFLLNSQSPSKNKSYVIPGVAAATVTGAAAGVTGATIGATIGALAIGIPTFGVAAGAGLVIGGAIGAGVGVAVGAAGTAIATKIKKKN